MFYGNLDLLLSEMHFLSEGGVGLPFGRGAWAALFQHLVDLFEGQTLGFGNKEVDEEERNAAKTAPHEEDVGAEVGVVLLRADQVGSDDGNDLKMSELALKLPNQLVEIGGNLRSSRTSWRRSRYQHLENGW